MESKKVRKLVTVAMLGALATIVMTLKTPVPFAPSMYKLDFSEAVVLIGAFVLGPAAAVVIEGIKVLLNLLIDGTVTAGIGELANFIMGCSFVVPAAIIYGKNKTFKGAMIATLVGVVSLCIVSGLTNAYMLIPAYAKAFNMPTEAIVAMGAKINPNANGLAPFIFYITVPFNLVKGALSGLVAVLLYSKAGKVLEKLWGGKTA